MTNLSGKDKQPERLERFKIRRSFIGYFLVAPALLYLLLLTFYPLFRTVQMSFADVTAAQWHFVGLQHYRALLHDPWFWNSLGVIGIFTIPAMIMHLLVGLGLALLLNEAWLSKTLRSLLLGFLILPWVFSTAASALVWTLLLHQQGPLNYLLVGISGRSAPIAFLAEPGLAMASLIAVNTWLAYPFFMIIILGGLQAIPPELYEAAEVDGANILQRFRYVTLPQLRPVLLSVTAIDLIWTFGHFDLINLLTRGGPLRKTETMTYYIYKTGMLDGNLGYGAAMSTVMLVGMTILLLVCVNGFSRGGESGETSF